MKRFRPTRYILILITTILPLLVYPEGTKEIMPDLAWNTRILLSTQSSRAPFALYNADSNYRLNIHIEDYTKEVIYFGLGQIRRSGNFPASPVNYRIHKPDGTVVFEKLTPVSGETGYINSYAEAIAGPDYLSPSGYDADSLYLNSIGENGDYFMTFQLPNNTYRTFEFFDITVIDISTQSKIDGRLFSKDWQISTFEEGIVGYYGFMFIYSQDSIVTKLNPNGFDGRHFNFGCNESGCYPVGPTMPANQARKSVAGSHTYPQYKVFINNPDINVYPSGVLGSLVMNNPVVQTTSFCDLGTLDFTFEVTATGSGELTLHCSELGPPFEDRVISQTVTQGWNTLTWDGLDGALPPNPVPNGSQFTFSLTYINGMTHLPLYDVENNEFGFFVTLVRPASTTEPAFYWDDTNFSPPMPPGPVINPPGGCLSSISSCHIWYQSGGQPGNNRTVNTWWFVANTSTTPVSITYIRIPPPPDTIYGPDAVCPGSSGHIFWINEEPSSTSYVWGYAGTGATITPVNDTTVSVDFVMSSTSGNFWVAGVNTDCGQGDSVIKAITIIPAPVVNLSAYTPVCIDELPFALFGGTPAGGTYTISGVPVTTFDPAVYGVGNHEVYYTYTDPGTGCTADDHKPLVVNPLPIVTLSNLNPVCVNEPAYTLTGGNPVNGTYSGPGVSNDSIFDPATAGAGTHEIVYSFTDGSGCTNSDTNTIIVYPLTPVDLPQFSPICINASPITLTGGTPPGGTYSGPGVVTGIFDPALASVGTFEIVYTYTDGNSCTNSDTNSITVNPLPGAPGIITGTDTVCQAAISVSYNTIPISDATSYIWTIIPAGAGTVIGTTTSILVNWSASFTGSAQITVKGLNDCGEGVVSMPFDIMVNPNPIVSFTRCFDSVTTTTAQPIVLTGGIPLNGVYTGQGVTAGILYPALAGSGIHSIIYEYTNKDGCAKDATTTITIQTPLPWNCGDLLTDLRDGQEYSTVLIGGQCWMAANLNYGTQIASSQSQRDNCIPEKYCYNDDTALCALGSALYQWDEVMTYRSAEALQGLCPPDWHIPTEADWNSLFAVFTSSGFAGNALKYSGYSGFDALLTGIRFHNNIWKFPANDPILRSILYWSSTLHAPNKVWAHGMNEVAIDIEYTPSVSFYPALMSNAFAVRCIKD